MRQGRSTGCLIWGSMQGLRGHRVRVGKFKPTLTRLQGKSRERGNDSYKTVDNRYSWAKVE